MSVWFHGVLNITACKYDYFLNKFIHAHHFFFFTFAALSKWQQSSQFLMDTITSLSLHVFLFEKTFHSKEENTKEKNAISISLPTLRPANQCWVLFFSARSGYMTAILQTNNKILLSTTQSLPREHFIGFSIMHLKKSLSHAEMCAWLWQVVKVRYCN